MPNTGSGRLGEQLTVEYLEEKGYEIVERGAGVRVSARARVPHCGVQLPQPLRRDRCHRAE